jgi:hypothetical protein
MKFLVFNINSISTCILLLSALLAGNVAQRCSATENIQYMSTVVLGGAVGPENFQFPARTAGLHANPTGPGPSTSPRPSC